MIPDHHHDRRLVAMIIGGNVVMGTSSTSPGMGQAMVTALNSRDYPIVQGCTVHVSVRYVHQPAGGSGFISGSTPRASGIKEGLLK